MLLFLLKRRSLVLGRGIRWLLIVHHSIIFVHQSKLDNGANLAAIREKHAALALDGNKSVKTTS